jgi:hypothetical protein
MTAVLDAIADLAQPAVAAREIQLVNDRLAAERTVPEPIAQTVREIVAAVDHTDLRRWHSIDPHHAVVLLHAAVSAQRALERPADPAARDQLRTALESMRQALATLAEGEPIGDDRSPKQVVQWLVGHTEVPQARLARLLGTSPRQLQRWVAAGESAQPEGDDARRVRLVARLVNQLRFVLTPAGTVEWFGWPRSDLDGKRPTDLLRDPANEPRLASAAAAMRGAAAA